MKPIEIEVAGVTFYYDRMDAFEALEVFGDLQKDLLPALGNLLTTAGEGGDGDALAGAVTKLSESLSGKQLRAWTDRLLTRDRVSVEVEGEARRLGPAERRLAFDQFTDILELLYHVLRIEFADPLFTYLDQLGVGQSIKATLGGALSENTATK